MVSKLSPEYFSLPQPTTQEKGSTRSKIDEIDSLIGLVKIGNAVSLAKARRELGVTIKELSTHMGVSENILYAWETESETPPHKNLLAWRIKVGNLLEEEIANYLGTSDPDVIHQFWDIMWRLNDLCPDSVGNPSVSLQT